MKSEADEFMKYLWMLGNVLLSIFLIGAIVEEVPVLAIISGALLFVMNIVYFSKERKPSIR